MAATTDPQTAGDTLSLESILERLTRVVESLERGDLPLEDSLKIFEEGVRLTREGQRRLDSAERRIEALLTHDGPDGQPALQIVPPSRS